jgi:anti-sigma B factor antagonist
MDMPRVTDDDARYTLVALDGEIDMHSSPAAREAILSALRGGRPVLIDLSAVTYIDSSGVANLVEGYQLARRQQIPFALLGVSEAAGSVLRLARLDKVFPIYASIADWPPAEQEGTS